MTKLLLRGAVSVVLAFSCSSIRGPTKFYQTATVNIVDVCRAPHNVPRYFPFGVFDANPKYDFEYGCWYSKELLALRERTLWPVSSEVEAYRFLWMRSFDPGIVIRAEKHDTNTHILVAKQIEPADEESPPKQDKITMYSHELTDSQWRELQYLLREASIWIVPSETMPVVYTPDGEISIRGDGAAWIFEAADHGKYHVANVWSPQPDGPDASYRKLCLYLLSLSGIEVPPKRIY